MQSLQGGAFRPPPPRGERASLVAGGSSRRSKGRSNAQLRTPLSRASYRILRRDRLPSPFRFNTDTTRRPQIKMNTNKY